MGSGILTDGTALLAVWPKASHTGAYRLLDGARSW